MKRLIIALFTLAAGACLAAPPDTAVSYQGFLKNNSQPAGGNFDFVFELYSTDTGGLPLSAQTNLTVSVTNGLFTTTFDPGAVFDSQPRWLGISVRASGGGAFTPLTGRQRISAAPKAVHAVSADTAQVAYAAEISSINSAALQDGAILDVAIATNASIADIKLATIVTAGKVANSATTATSSNVPNAIVVRNEFGDFEAGIMAGEGLDVTGVIRSGSEDGTAEAPFLPEGGMIYRRLNSSVTTSNSIIARTDSCSLVRDGTTAGLRVNFTASGEKLSFTAQGLSFYGTNVNFRATTNSTSSGSIQLFSNAQRVIHARVTFGDVYGSVAGHVTHVVLDRFDSAAESDFYLTGIIFSSYNQ